ncbi:trypco2 family protein [Frankia sp. Cj3]|uniref:trypco2 family protein n=1 Tax=Frankia sp. Cj3 TaxID=2880976 RepID=UPI001EF6DB35|nr:trypco2 family protein [Frankia sp. Cj3]
MSNEPGVDLAVVIRTLRAQFTQALADGAAGDIDFAVGEINLEFQVAVTTSGEVKTGAKFWVLSADAAATRDVGSVHRLAVTLTPGLRMPDGTVESLHVADTVPEQPVADTVAKRPA